MEINSNLDVVLHDYNQLSNNLEQQYLDNRDEEKLELVIRNQDLYTILLGTCAIDGHRIADVLGDGDKIVIKLEKI